MKTVSVLQPWATFCILGWKGNETRSWPTNYRGPLAIHASKNVPNWVFAWFFECDPARELLARLGILRPHEILSLPLGKVLGTVDLMDVRKITAPPTDAREAALGNYTPGRFAWMLANPKAFVVPFSARGALGLWEWPGEAVTNGA